MQNDFMKQIQMEDMQDMQGVGISQRKYIFHLLGNDTK